ncbi:unnamed protein product [Periconia digitata]|uniref:Myb-like domain-containing protein n=1 Tax=Periconia digitata TaxID=1303443 RepID=A0A9W4UEW8_9PLEO|nr:unnamed protein product [Periconia digitata]
MNKNPQRKWLWLVGPFCIFMPLMQESRHALAHPPPFPSRPVSPAEDSQSTLHARRGGYYPASYLQLRLGGRYPLHAPPRKPPHFPRYQLPRPPVFAVVPHRHLALTMPNLSRPCCPPSIPIRSPHMRTCPFLYPMYKDQRLLTRQPASRPLSLASPVTKRSLKPSPIAAAPQRTSPFAQSADLASIQPAPTLAPALAPAPSIPGQDSFAPSQLSPVQGANSRKRKSVTMAHQMEDMAGPVPASAAQQTGGAAEASGAADADALAQEPKVKKSRTNTPWTPAEEQRLKQMRDAGNSWSEIAKVRMDCSRSHIVSTQTPCGAWPVYPSRMATFPQRTEGSVKKHWYKDMHYAEFGEDESAALLSAIKEYDANKWKSIGQKVGKPAKACEQYAKEHFGGKY